MSVLKLILGKKAVLPKHVNLEIPEKSICRICLSSNTNDSSSSLNLYESIATEISTMDMISPCACKGSMKFIHKTCLREWRYQKKNLNTVNKCDQCLTEYFVPDDFIPRPSVVNFITLFIFAGLLYLVHFVLITLIEAYIYTYRVYNYTEDAMKRLDELLKGESMRPGDGILRFMEESLNRFSIYKTLIYFATFNSVITMNKRNWMSTIMFTIFLIRSIIWGQQSDHLLLISYSVYGVSDLYKKLYVWNHSLISYWLNFT